MTGTGMNVITNNDTQSYNTAVSAINKHQKDNVAKLESALVVANSNNEKLQNSLNEVNRSINNLKKQIFINDALIQNWDRNTPYVFDLDLLN